MVSQSNREVEVVGPIHTAPLVVSARVNAKSDRQATFDNADRKQKARVQLRVVRRNCVDLSRRVPSPFVAVRATARALAMDHDHVTSIPSLSAAAAIHASAIAPF
jgi:hypothetical protein